MGVEDKNSRDRGLPTGAMKAEGVEMEEAASERVELATTADNEAMTTSPGVRPEDLAPGRMVVKSRVLMLALAVLAFGVGVGMLIGAHCNYSSAAEAASAEAAPAPRPSK